MNFQNVCVQNQPHKSAGPVGIFYPAIVALLIVLGFAAGVWAENTNEQPREAWMDASDYASTHLVVTFAVYGHAKDATTHQIGEVLKARFAQMGVPSVYFTSREDRLGSSVYFYLKDLQYGPVGLSKTPETIQTIARHFPQAYPHLKTKTRQAKPSAAKH